MRYGYSMVLGEFVEAGEVDFGDTERFQIACPVCREAIFKKVRARSDGATTHFLSHYRAESEEEKDCELRVAALAREQFEPFMGEGRGQALKSFLLVLREQIERTQIPEFRGVDWPKSIQRLLSRPSLDWVVTDARDALETMLAVPDPRKALADTLAEFPAFDLQSPFWLRRRAAYVLDVLRHLLTPQAKPNLKYLTAAAVMNIGHGADRYRKHIEGLRVPSIGYDPTPAIDLMEGMVMGKSDAALKKIVSRATGADRARTPGDVRVAQMRLRAAVMSEILGPMIGVLAKVPFPDIAGKSEEVHNSADRLLKDFMRMLESLEKQARGPQREV